jgi:hypothetical protein
MFSALRTKILKHPDLFQVRHHLFHHIITFL